MLTNSGGSATGMLSVSLGSATEFSITADACTGTALGPRKSCNVTVQYAPTTAGQTTATLAANAIRPVASTSISLTGTGVAVAVRHIYWANLNTNTIGRADLDGSNPNQSFITGASTPRGVAVDAEHIYWANSFTDTIGRADLDGANPNQSFITGASKPRGVTVDAEHIYWTNAPPPTRSAGPTSTARTRTRASSPARPTPRCGGRRRTSTGPTPAPARSAGPTRRREPEPELHHRRVRPHPGGGRRRAHLLDQPRHRHDRPGRPRRREPEPELHHRRVQPPWRGGRRRAHLLEQRLPHQAIGRADLDGANPNQSFIPGVHPHRRGGRPLAGINLSRAGWQAIPPDLFLL